MFIASKMRLFFKQFKSSKMKKVVLTICLFITVSSAFSQTDTKSIKNMKVQDLFTLICTNKMIECRDFYVKHFGFEVAFQSTIYVQLSIKSESGGAFSLALMPPDNPFTKEFKDVYKGKGAYVTIQVTDTKQLYEQLKKEGLSFVTPVRDELWGQRHFVTKDPNGTIIDVVENIEPAKGFYDNYQIKEK
jgi:uncharacterized glyoxalase superfamily protein PhnB